VYGKHAHLQEYDRGADSGFERAEEWVPGVHAAAAQALGMRVEDVVLKRRAKRHGPMQHEKTGTAGEELVVVEGGHRFIVNLHAYLDTGLFLDHRETRALVQSQAAGRRFLNLFCYTGSFTVYAAAGGAVSSLSLDLSNTYLEWARRNFELNDVERARHSLERADVLDWLERAATPAAYDLIVLDPPSFSASKAMHRTLDIQRDHPELLAHCERLLAPGGTLYFSTNLRSFRLDPAAAPGLSGEEISDRTVPEDFRNRRIHRCWRFARR